MIEAYDQLPVDRRKAAKLATVLRDNPRRFRSVNHIAKSLRLAKEQALQVGAHPVFIRLRRMLIHGECARRVGSTGEIHRTTTRMPRSHRRMRIQDLR